jgi:FkbM family methyltransferase
MLRADQPLGRLARLPLKLVPAGTTLPVLAGPNRGTRWIAGSGPHSCWLGFNEWTKRRLFARMLRRGMVVYDVGANVGSYSVLASLHVGHAGRVVAIEPAPENLEFLRRHLQLNDATNVSVIAAAAWNQSGTVRFERHPDRLQGHVADRGGQTVQAVTLDDLIRNGEPRPHIMKIDVEGGEAEVLEGASEVLELARPLIFVATHGEGPERRVRALLKKSGYTMRGIGRSHEEWLAEPDA